ncbi:hypothetical protein CYLTODRAFT_485082 [Cylindrobasidium torrendii FP15055 ss-10]|uniref:Uncharacterized protein n=1 Tax=Cylindrobasidium torrendii FP15055 ss-10 TaxID=1314674 RepID=A0A0D7BTU1_9AGAR|nr:hypothetical protein CYLTODRAFT_485082 [Cylindrobasidium torrendii FP15055 ss-10]
MEDDYSDILGKSSLPGRHGAPASSQPGLTDYIKKGFLFLFALAMVYVAGVHLWNTWQTNQKLKETLAMRRRHGIPDSDHRPFNVAYAAAMRAQQEKENEKAREPRPPVEESRIRHRPTGLAPPLQRSNLPGHYSTGSLATTTHLSLGSLAPVPSPNRVTFADGLNTSASPAPGPSHISPRKNRHVSAMTPATKRQLDDYEDDFDDLKKTRIEGEELIDGDEQPLWSQDPYSSTRGSKRGAGDDGVDIRTSKKARERHPPRHYESTLSEEDEMEIEPTHAEHVTPSRGQKRAPNFDADELNDSAHVRPRKTNKRRSDPAIQSRGMKRDRDLDDEMAEEADEQSPQALRKKRGKKAEDSIIDGSMDGSFSSRAHHREIGDEWESNGIHFKIGPNAQRLRKALVKRSQKYPMPADSIHPDKETNIDIYVECWLSDDEYRQAREERRLPHQETPPRQTPTISIPESPMDVTGKRLLWETTASPQPSPVRAQTPVGLHTPNLNLRRSVASVGIQPTSFSRRITNNIPSPSGSPGLSDSTNSIGIGSPRPKSYSKWEKQDLEAKALNKIRGNAQNNTLALPAASTPAPPATTSAPAAPASVSAAPASAPAAPSGGSLFPKAIGKPAATSLFASPVKSSPLATAPPLGASNEAEKPAAPTSNLFAKPAAPSDTSKAPEAPKTLTITSNDKPSTSLFSDATPSISNPGGSAPAGADKAKPVGLGMPSTFGAPPAPTPTPAPAQKSLFNFGAPAAASAAPAPAPASNPLLSRLAPEQPAPSNAAKSGFSFDAPKAAGGTTSLFGKPAGSSGAPTSLFGKPAAPATTSIPSPASTPAAPATSAFGAPPAASTPAAPVASAFGAPAAPSAFGKPAEPAATTAPTFSFKPAAATATTATTTTTPTFSFGAPAKPAEASKSAFGGNVFGGKTAESSNNGSAPASGSGSGSLFGSKPAAPTSSLFGSKPPEPAANPFGAPAKSVSTPASTGLFNFGAAAAAKKDEPAPAAPVASAFGAAPSASTSAFGAPAASAFGAPAASAFGAPAASATTPAASAPPSSGFGIFGAAKKDGDAPKSVFGGGDAAKSAFGSQPAPAASGTSLFGAGAKPAGATLFGGGSGTAGSVFGSNDKPKEAGSAPAFGGGSTPTTTFNFGSTTKPAEGAGLFGKGPAAGGGTFTFGAGNPAPSSSSSTGVKFNFGKTS